MTFMALHSGRYFDFEDPENADYDIKDIAHALSNICRFTGHTEGFYSVAQHSVLVSHIVPQEHALAALLHDGSEAYLGDVSNPLKSLLPDYRHLEARVERALLARFGLTYPQPRSIKQADLRLLATERRDLMLEQRVRWPMLDNVTPVIGTIRPMLPQEAEQWFIDRFNQLTEGEQ